MKCRTCHTDTGTTHDGQCTYCWTLTPRPRPALLSGVQFAPLALLEELEAAHGKAKELSERAESEGRTYLAIDLKRIENLYKTLADAERRWTKAITR